MNAHHDSGTDCLLVDHPRPGVVRLTLNRPQALNALTAEIVDALHRVLGSLRANSAVRAIVLTGAGRAFCAGLDLHGYGTPREADPEEGTAQSRMRIQQHLAGLAEAFTTVRAPIIAAVNGPAAGGGMALSLFSDIRIAAPTASFHASFLRRGFSNGDMGTSWLLPRLIGFSRAADLLMTGGTVDAVEAERIGLVSCIADDVLGAALTRAEAIAENSPFGVWMTKEVLWSNLEVSSMSAALALENRTQLLAASTEDHREAVAAFLEKRRPQYRNL